jgi:peptidoglycan hydrolase-like protein with peptidoglycan-binding domain
MGAGVNRVATVAMVSGVLVGTSALGYGLVHLTAEDDPQVTVTTAREVPGAQAAKNAVRTAEETRQHARREARHQARQKASQRPARQVSAPLPTSRPQVIPEPGPRLLGPGDNGPKVRDLQARLRQIAWYAGDVTDDYGSSTTAAVKGFQAKREIAVTGYVDQRTLDRLDAMTRTPTADELANRLPGSTTTGAALDPRCATGRALCIDKSSSTVRWVVDGKVLQTMAVRFGSSYTPTREGLFSVNSKSRDHVSSLYDTAMPFAMFFSGGQAVHYSPDFAARGYAGASHGCVNVRDYNGIASLFDQVNVGDKVVIYWS